MKFCAIDFETRSLVDLKSTGSYNYINDDSTEPLCYCFTTSMYPGFMYLVRSVQDVWSEICDAWQDLWSAAADPDCYFIAHNVPFDKQCYDKFLRDKYGFPDIPLSRWVCNMAMCFAFGLPGDLKQAAVATQLVNQKDIAGRKSMLFLSKPKTQKQGGGFWTPEEKPKEFQDLYSYCGQDVSTMVELFHEIPMLTPNERAIWELDYKINQRGIMFDLPLVRKVIGFMEIEQGDIFSEFNEIAGFDPSQRKVFKQWMFDMYKIELKDTQKATLEKVYKNVGPEIQTAIDLVLQAGKTSLAKYPTIVKHTDSFGIFRGISQYHGAHTGRFAHRAIQLGNLARPVNSSGEEFSIATIVRALQVCDYQTFGELYDNVSEALSFAIRGMIVARPDMRWDI